MGGFIEYEAAKVQNFFENAGGISYICTIEMYGCHPFEG